MRDRPAIALSNRPLTAITLLTLTACTSRSSAPDARPAIIPIELSTVAAPDTVLGQFRDLVIAPDGYWIVAAGGVPLAYYGRTLSEREYPDVVPGGPNQVRSALSLDVTTAGHALVWDGILGRIVEVAPSGEVTPLATGPIWLQTPQTPGWDFLGGTRNQLLALDRSPVAGFLDRSRAGSGDFHRLIFRPVFAVDSAPVLDFSSAQSWLDSTLTSSRLFAPFPIVARCGRSQVAVYQPTDRTVEIRDADWAVVRTIPLPRTPVDRTPERAQALFIARLVQSTQGKVPLAEIVERVRTAPPGAFEAAASVLPAYLNLLCTPSGRVLIEDSQIDAAEPAAGAVWEVYSANGEERRFEFPAGFRLFDASDDELVGVLLDSLDVPSVAVAKWPEG